MSKTFRSWDVDQAWLLPPSVHEFVPEGRLAHFVRDTVREGLDLSAILGVYGEERGYPPYHPGMMTALLLYGYSRGVYSSGRLAQACEERMDFMATPASALRPIWPRWLSAKSGPTSRPGAASAAQTGTANRASRSNLSWRIWSRTIP